MSEPSEPASGGHSKSNVADPLVRVERSGSTARLILNRPSKKNAMSNKLLVELAGGLDAAIADPGVASIVLSGAGSCFSAGRDTNEFSGRARLQNQSLDQDQEGFLRVLETLMEAPKPTIAAVHGFAFGGGQALTLACDFVVAERGAVFGNVEMAYGFPAAMNTVLLARHVGRRLGLEIALTGERYTAERFYEIGLVNRLAEPGGLEAAVAAFTEVLNARTAWSVARTKATFRVAEDQHPRAALHTGNQLNQLLMLQSQTEPVHSGSAEVRRSIGATKHE